MHSTPGTAPSTKQPHLKMHDVVYVLNHPTRWHFLKLLAAEEAVMVQQAAKRLGLTATNVSKHLTVLRAMGVARHGLAKLYHLAEQYRTHVGQREIDFGHCLVRFEHF